MYFDIAHKGMTTFVYLSVSSMPYKLCKYFRRVQVLQEPLVALVAMVEEEG